MYKLTIKTKYNIIRLKVDDIESPEVKEILEQPYIIETKIENIENEENISTENVQKLKLLPRKRKKKFD